MTCEILQISLLFPCHVLTVTKIASAMVVRRFLGKDYLRMLGGSLANFIS